MVLFGGVLLLIFDFRYEEMKPPSVSGVEDPVERGQEPCSSFQTCFSDGAFL